MKRCLRRDRSRRFQGMGDVRVRLQEIIDDPAPAGEQLARPAAPAWKYAVRLATLLAIAAIGAAIAFFPRAHAAPPPLLRRLTWDGGLTMHPSVSRDGTTVAYASDRANHGNLDIWIERLGGGDPLPLTSDSVDESAPDISPDGTRVTYRSERNGGGVYVVPSFGGTPHLVAAECRDPKYSPDNKTIACWIGDIGGVFYPKAARIVLVPAGGGPPVTFRPDFDAAAFPLWMQDGTGRLLFLGRKNYAQRRSLVDWFLGRKNDAQGNSVVDWWVAGETPGSGEHPAGALKAFTDLGLNPVTATRRIRRGVGSGGSAVRSSARREDAINVWRLPSPRTERLRCPRAGHAGARAGTRSVRARQIPATRSRVLRLLESGRRLSDAAGIADGEKPAAAAAAARRVAGGIAVGKRRRPPDRVCGPAAEWLARRGLRYRHDRRETRDDGRIP